MRLFVALYPPPAALEHLARAVAQTRLATATAQGTNVGLTPRERWHITLVFLGELPPARVSSASAALGEAVARWRAQGGRAPALRLAGAGTFGRRRFTVVWVGLADDLTGLRTFGAALRNRLRRHGLSHDDKPFRPHLTIARPGERLPAAALAADLELLHAYRGPRWWATEVHLVHSRPGPHPVHESITTHPLVRRS